MSRPTPPEPSTLVADPSFLALKEYVIGVTGLAYYEDKNNDLARRMAPRLAERGQDNCAGYLALLRGPEGADELDDLIKDLTVGETFFFRHSEMFEALRSVVLPDLIARNRPQRRLRIWSAGCAIGAEPYSLSILLRRDLVKQVAGWDLTIVGTDINREFLARAHEGRYEEWALRSTPEELRQACFRRAGRSWVLDPHFKEGVHFQYHNLVTHPYPSLLNNLFAFDLVLCRNVMIYFSKPIMQRIVAGFHQSLVEGGWLLVGHAEPNAQMFQAFRVVNTPGAVLYQKNQERAGHYDSASPSPVPTPRTWRPEPSTPPAPGPWPSPALPWSTPQPEPATLRTPPPARPARHPRSTVDTPREPVPPPAGAPPRPATLDSVRALADAGAWEQALAGCRELLETDKLNPRVHFYHGLVLEQMGQYPEAEQALRRAIYLDRRFVLAHYSLGLLLQNGEQLAQAARSFQNVLGLLPHLDRSHVFPDGDGLTAGELARLTRMHLRVLEQT